MAEGRSEGELWTSREVWSAQYSAIISLTTPSLHCRLSLLHPFPGAELTCTNRWGYTNSPCIYENLIFMNYFVQTYMYFINDNQWYPPSPSPIGFRSLQLLQLLRPASPVSKLLLSSLQLHCQHFKDSTLYAALLTIKYELFL